MKKPITLFLAAILAPALSSATSFFLTDTSGTRHELESYRGKWVLVNVWATWCAPCIAELPELQALHQSHRDLAVLGLSIDGQQNKDKVLRFSSRLGVSYPIIIDDVSAGQRFGVKGFPTTLLYDPAGNPVFEKAGKVTRAEIEKAMRR